jgi:hypothetical protein
MRGRKHDPNLGRVLPAALLAAAMAASGGAVVGQPVANTEPEANRIGILVDHKPVYDVKLDGRLMRLKQYVEAERPRAAAEGRRLRLVVDATAGQRGYFVAFSNDRNADNYERSVGMGPLPAVPTNQAAGDAERAELQLAEAAAVQPTLNGRAISTVVCSLPSRYAYMYKDTSCNGSYLSMVDNDYISHLSTYGFNDVVSSFAIGCKISNLRVWEHHSKGGSSTSFGGGGVYSTVGTWNDRISSTATDSSAAC